MTRLIHFVLLTLTLVGLAGCATTSQDRHEPDSLATAESHFAKLGTNKVHYLTVGHGSKTIVFVHCWAGNSGFWREQVPALADKARLLLIDLPGHGQSDKPHTAYTMDFFASAVVAVLRDAHVERATLVGHSMGVPVICRAYAQAPDKVAALVAADGFLRRPQITPEQAAQFIDPFRKPDYREHARKFISSMFPIPGTESLRNRVVSEVLSTPQHVMLGAMEGMFGAGQPDWDPKRVSVPVLVLNAKDPVWTPQYEEYARALSPQTDYRVMDGVGHWLMLEKPAEFNALLTDMLRKCELIAR